MKPLNDGEKALLRDLSMDPTFASLCEKIAGHKRVPRFKPGGKPEEQQARWVYDSGWADGVAFALNVIGYKHE